MELSDKKYLLLIGNNIRKLREIRGISQFELATESDLSKNQIGRIERAEISTSILTLKKIADVLSVKVEDLIAEASV
ncbi:anaerobic benzoate catabolism transcriptional regulator [Algoriella xinjiangensis]|uniref:helix-turn-helix domain-containing protein n=1 Tax=Algoriella xinjiangensis TaxID=684065 RepID=UPI000F63C77C|nr:helix-turn-helix transcriptional regulator [Algoriella xinjiangensis]VDH15615.1 anaerobic benzoate catabolism transcriptional regulator [Algoriella xinjiangensis]